MTIEEEYPYVLIHKTGPKPCGKIALRLTHKPESNDIMESKDTATPSGEPIAPYSKIICLACETPLFLERLTATAPREPLTPHIMLETEFNG